MPVALEAVFPIFLIIGIGAIAAARGVVTAAGAAAISGFAARIGIPILIFHTLVNADLSGMSPWLLWASYFPGAAIAWMLGTFLVGRVLGRDARTAVIGGLGSAFANTAFIGLPLVDRIWGAHGALVVTVLIAIHVPLMLSSATLLMERAERLSGGVGQTWPRLLRQILTSVAGNPIVVAIVCASVLRVVGWPLPGVVRSAVGDLARAAGPVALFALGAGLRRAGLVRDAGAALAVAAVKLMVMPAAVWVFGHLLGLEATTLGPLVILAGVPAGVNVHLVAVHHGVGQALGAGVVVASTVLGALTESLWLGWLV